jgi:putative phage-type endonuclease
MTMLTMDSRTEEPVEERDVLDGRAAFLAERRTGIMSTDVAAILGLSRWATALSVYREKVGEAADDRPSLPAWIGLRLENLVAELYSAATENRLRSDNRLHRSHEYDWIACHLDRRVVGDSGIIVELKTRNSARGWGEPGTADVPPDVWCQVQSQLLVTGAREVHVAVLFSNSRFDIYRVLPDPEFWESLIPDLRAFWFDHVVARVPPAPSGHDIDTEIIAALGGGETGVMKAATPEQEEIISVLRLARAETAKAELAEAEAANRVKLLIGEDADGISGSFGIITWKRTKEVEKTNWKTLASVYEQALSSVLDVSDPNDPVVAAAADTLIEALALCTRFEPGSRRFLPKFVED